MKKKKQSKRSFRSPESISSDLNNKTKRKPAEEELHIAEEYFRSIVTAMDEGVVFQNKSGEITVVNPAAVKILGLTAGELIAQTSEVRVPDAKIIHEDGSVFPRELQPAMITLRTGKPQSNVVMGIHRADGTLVWISVNSQPLTSIGESKPYAVVTTFRDITRRKSGEEQLRRLNRVYTVLSNINQAIVRIHDPQRLFQEACRIAVEEGKFQMAWIGMVNAETQKVDVVASCGNTQGYLENINIDMGDEKRSSGPTGRAIKKGTHVFSNDVESDVIMRPWRENALRCGYRSTASFPLNVFGNTRGAFTLYSSEVGFFNENEAKLLDELAMDISFAIESRQQESERKTVEKALQISEEKFLKAFRSSPIALTLAGVEDGVLREANHAFEQITGYSIAEALGKTAHELNLYPDPRERERLVEMLGNKGEVRNAEMHLRHKSGESRTVQCSSESVTIGNSKYILATTEDITERKRAEDLLRESEERLRAIYEGTNIGITFGDLTPRFLNINPAMQRILGYSGDELNRKTMAGITHPDDIAADSALFQELLAGKRQHYEIEKRYFHKDGHMVWGLAGVSLVHDAKGKPQFAIGILEDITERKRAEEALRQSEERFRRLAENAQDMIYRMSLPDGKYEYVSPAALSVFGHSPEEFYNTPILIKQAIHPDWRKYFEEQWANLIKGEVPPTYEYQINHKSGEVRWLNQRNILVRDNAGNPIAIEGIVTDITERKQMENALRENEVKFRALSETTSSAIFIYQGEKFVYVNPAFEAISGYSLDDLSTLCFWDIVHPEFRELVKERGTRRQRGELMPSQYEFKIITKNGDVRWIDFTATFIEFLGKPAALGTAFDITDRKQAEEALWQTNELLERVFANVDLLIACMDVNFNFMRVNRAYAEADHRTPEFFAGKNHFELYPDEENENIFRRVIQTGEPYFAYAKPFVYAEHPERGITYWNWTLQPMKEVDGSIGGLVLSLLDVTERERAARELRAASLYVRSLIEANPDPLVTINPEGKITDVNRATEQVTGVSRERLIGDDFSNYFTEPEKASEGYQKVLADGLVRDYPLTIRHTSGKTTDVLYNATVYRNEMGEIQGVFAAARDITERKHAEETVRESETKFRAVFESSVDAIGVSKVGVHTFVNPAYLTLFGYADSDELIGKPILDLIAPSHREQILENVRRRAKGEPTPSIYETRGLRKDGSEFDMDVHASNYELNGENYTLVILRDITERKRAQDALDLFRSLVDRSSDAIEVIDPETGRFLNVNEKACLDLGYSREELLALSVFHIEPTLDKSLFTGTVEELRKSDALMWEGIHRRKDGSTFPVEVNIKYVRLDRDYIVTAVRDISDRKRAEETQLLQTTALESAANGVVITDLTGKILWVNTGFTKTSGYSLHEVIGQNPRMLKSGRQDDALYKNLWETISAGNVWKGELTNKRKDETLYDEEMTITPVRNRDNKVTHFVAIKQDVSERKRAEEALKKSEEQYRHFFEDDLTGDYISTPGGKILSCNLAFARIFGFASVEEALNADASTVFAEPESEGKFLHLLREKKRLEYYESEFIRRDGSRVYCVENAVGIFDANGTLVQIRGYLFDETKRKSLEQQLVQAQKLESLGTLASGVAHDFNNILGIILGYASLLTRQDLEPERIKSNAEAVIKASHRGAGLVKQLLTFARKVDVQLRSVRLNDSVDEVAKLLSETMPRTIEIGLHMERNLPAITGDPTQLHQVLINLCVNARDAMPDGGKLTITTGRRRSESIQTKFPKVVAHEYIMLSVADTGAGMDKDTRGRIFEPFFTTKEVGKGTGLGLAVVFGIMETHKGFVDVESEPGRGTTFYLYFPVPQSVEIEQPKAETQKEIPRGTETLLVIEDEEMLRELLRTALQTAGYTVLSAADGHEALDVFNEHQNDIRLVVSDMGLPKLSGSDVFRKMKARNPNLKFILASGFVEPQLKSEIFKEGVRDFIQKPYSLYEVLRAVRTILDQK